MIESNVTRILFFERGDDGLCSVVDIVELQGGPAEAWHIARRWYGKAYAGFLFTMSAGYTMPDGDSFFPFTRPTISRW
jgi:hypothetical protein